MPSTAAEDPKDPNLSSAALATTSETGTLRQLGSVTLQDWELNLNFVCIYIHRCNVLIILNYMEYGNVNRIPDSHFSDYLTMFDISIF